MANRFPLVVDTTDSKIKEIPTGDSIDLEGSGIVNLSDLSLSTSLVVGADATITGGLSVTGTTTLSEVTATNLTINGIVPLTSQTKADWTEENENSPAFIQNKPTFAHGIGEQFEAINLNLSAFEIVIIKPINEVVRINLTFLLFKFLKKQIK